MYVNSRNRSLNKLVSFYKSLLTSKQSQMYEMQVNFNSVQKKRQSVSLNCEPRVQFA